MVEIRLSPKAELKYNQILDYTLDEFGKIVEKRFEECFLEKLKRLSMFPLSSPVEPRLRKYKIFRSCILMEDFKFIYRYSQERNLIVVLDFWDMRMNPSRLVRTFWKDI